MAVGNALLDMYNEVQRELAEKNGTEPKKQPPKKAPKPKAVKNINKESILCPQCGEPLVFEGGCNVCKSCGWSKCF